MKVTSGISAAALFLMTMSSEAYAARHHRPGERISCSEVRYYVARYSAAVAEMYARSQGATNLQIGRDVAWPRTKQPKQGNNGPTANKPVVAAVLDRSMATFAPLSNGLAHFTSRGRLQRRLGLRIP